MTPILDAHQHLWDLTRLRLPWVGGEGPLARSFVMGDYLREAEGLGIVGTVYMEVDVAPEQREAEADAAMELCASPDNPMRGAVVRGDPAAQDFPEWAARLARPPCAPYVRGVRQVLHGALPAGYCTQPAFIAGAQLLGEMGLTFDICIRPGELADAARLLDACPDTRFILDHCGNADVRADASARESWRRGVADVAERPNVACKVSGIVASALPGAWGPEDLAPIVRQCAEAFGPDRLLFGGDWPVCTHAASLREWVEALHQIVDDWPVEEQRKLFHDNALRVYGLPEA